MTGFINTGYSRVNLGLAIPRSEDDPRVNLFSGQVLAFYQHFLTQNNAAIFVIKHLIG